MEEIWCKKRYKVFWEKYYFQQIDWFYSKKKSVVRNTIFLSKILKNLFVEYLVTTATKIIHDKNYLFLQKMYP